MPTDFYTDHEKEIIQQFLTHKHIIVPAEDKDVLCDIRKKVAEAAAPLIKANTSDPDTLLNHIHEYITVAELNDLRLKVIAEINRDPWFRKAYFKIGRNILTTLVGNELAMQRRINLSIQLPNDDSSLLPVHADVWAGDSPYEIVMWVPLVDCYKTKSMFITKAQTDEKVQTDFSQFKGKSSEDLYQHIEKDVIFLDIPFGTILLFSQNVMHGNRINREKETRWSMNCRFKSILTPYQAKKMGEFFEPITIRPITRLGLNYRLPGGLHDE